MSRRQNIAIIISAIFIFLLYGLISFVNHFNFRTYALDLGLYNNAIYDYAHLRINDSPCISEHPVNLLADHFDLFLILISPLYWLFGTYTLLVIQVVVLTFGGVGIYCILKFNGVNTFQAVLFAFMFWIFFGVFNAVGYDYHGNVIASGLLPWFVYFLIKNKYKIVLLFFILIIINKESMALWMSFVSSGYAWIYRKNSFKRNFLVGISVFALGYFVLLIGKIMPALGHDEIYAHTEYSAFGYNFTQIIWNILSHPFTAFKYLFVEHVPGAQSQYLKLEFHAFIMLSGGIFLLLRPAYLWMMIPIYMTKLYHDRAGIHGIGGQYAIEFAPIIVLCCADFINSLKPGMRLKICIALLVSVLAVTIRNFDHTIAFTNKKNIRFYKAEHYRSDFDRVSVLKAFSLIPNEAAISVQTQFHPHLAYRDIAYSFPMSNKEVKYFLFSSEKDIYPLTKAEIDSVRNNFLSQKTFTEIFNQKGIHLFYIKDESESR